MIANLGLGELLWSLLVIYIMVMYFVIVIAVVIDIFRSDDMGGGMKAVWCLLLLFIPIITLIVYLISRGDDMGKRSLASAKRHEEANQEYIRSVAAPGGGVASELEKAKGLLDSGAITADEYANMKAKILG